MRSQAVVFTGLGQVAVREVNCPDPGPNDVVISVRYSWISVGTESSFLRGERIAGDVPRRDGAPWPFPVVAGYQKVGTVEWVGEGVTDLNPGQTVFASRSRVEGLFSPLAGHVSPSVVARAEVWPLPEDRDPLAFAGLVLTQVGYNCGSRAALEGGDVAVVLGDGLVAHWAAQTLAWRGAQVVLLGRHPYRLARFQAGPQNDVLDTTAEPARAWLEKRFPEGFAVLVDTVGSIGAVEELAPLLGRLGHIVSAGFYGSEDRLALQPLREREVSVDLVSGWEHARMNATLQLIVDGHLETLPLITHHFPVARASEAWRMIVNHTEPFLGVILDW